MIGLKELNSNYGRHMKNEVKNLNLLLFTYKLMAFKIKTTKFLTLTIIKTPFPIPCRLIFSMEFYWVLTLTKYVSNIINVYVWSKTTEA